MSEAPILNQDVLQELNAELGPENTVEVLKVFLADTARKMSMIAARDVSPSVVKREAHSIKSSAGTFGFERLSRLALELEASAESMEAACLSASIAAFRRAFGETSDLAESRLLNATGETLR